MLKLITLMDNALSENKSLIHAHGLSYLVEYCGKRFLFDCGSGDAVLHNAHRLGVDLGNLDGVILSHSHYDHAGGYRDMVEQGNGGTNLYMGQYFFEKKYAFDGLKYTDLSPGFAPDFLEQYGISHHTCQDLLELAPGMWLVSSFERIHSFETIPQRFVKQTRAGIVPDEFEDEICLAMKTEKGLVILVGCSHPGILNMVETVHKRLNLPIYAVFGGTHLVDADEQRVRETVSALKQMGLTIFGIGHCSGEVAESQIRADCQLKSCHMAVGNCFFVEVVP